MMRVWPGILWRLSPTLVSMLGMQGRESGDSGLIARFAGLPGESVGSLRPGRCI